MASSSDSISTSDMEKSLGESEGADTVTLRKSISATNQHDDCGGEHQEILSSPTCISPLLGSDYFVMAGTLNNKKTSCSMDDISIKPQMADKQNKRDDAVAGMSGATRFVSLSQSCSQSGRSSLPSSIEDQPVLVTSLREKTSQRDEELNMHSRVHGIDDQRLPPIHLTALDSLQSRVSTSELHDNSSIRSESLTSSISQGTEDVSTNRSSNNISKCLLSYNQSLSDVATSQKSGTISKFSDEVEESIVNLSIYRPHYPNMSSYTTTVKCRVLVLPEPVMQSIDRLMEGYVYLEYLERLPTVIKGFKVPKRAVVALEFFKDVNHGDHVEPSLSTNCDGRIFVPSYLFHLVSSRDLYIPNDEHLSHVILDHSFDSVTIELPLGLCPSNIPPPIDEGDAENRFIDIAEQLSSGYQADCPVTRFSVTSALPIPSTSPRSPICLHHSPKDHYDTELGSINHFVTSKPSQEHGNTIVNSSQKTQSYRTYPSVPPLRYIPSRSGSLVTLSPERMVTKKYEDRARSYINRNESVWRCGTEFQNQQMSDYDFPSLPSCHVETTTSHGMSSVSGRNEVMKQKRESQFGGSTTGYQDLRNDSPPRSVAPHLFSGRREIGKSPSRSSQSSTSGSNQCCLPTSLSHLSSPEQSSIKQRLTNRTDRDDEHCDLHRQSTLWRVPHDILKEGSENLESYEPSKSPRASCVRYPTQAETYRQNCQEILPKRNKISRIDINGKSCSSPPHRSQSVASPCMVQHEVLKRSVQNGKRNKMTWIPSSGCLDHNKTRKLIGLPLAAPIREPPPPPPPQIHVTPRVLLKSEQVPCRKTRNRIHPNDVDSITALSPCVPFCKKTMNKPSQESHLSDNDYHFETNRPLLSKVADPSLFQANTHEKKQTLSTGASTSQLLNSSHVSLYSTEMSRPSSNCDVVPRQCCTRRRRKTYRLTDRYIRHRLNTLLTGLLDESRPSRQSSSVLSTSSTIASSIRGPCEEFGGQEKFIMECRNCSRQQKQSDILKNNQLVSFTSNLRYFSRLLPRLMNVLYYCPGVTQFVDVTCWIRRRTRTFLISFIGS